MSHQPGFLGTFAWDSAGGTSYTTIAKIRDLTGPSISRTDIEIADRSQTNYYKQYIGGMVDPGAITFDLTWDPIATAGHGTAILNNFESSQCSQATYRWQLDGCGGTATMTFSGYFNSLEVSAPLEDVLTASVGVKISGKPTLTVA